jgi:release factor glutamine methyltransferase
MYEPREDSYLLQDSVKEFLKKNKITVALDMGTGTGIQGKTLFGKIDTVIMTDINKDATDSLLSEITDIEKKSNKTETEIKIYSGDLFENVPKEYKEKIELIIFNPPYLPREKDEKDDLELTSGESGIETTKRFLTYAKEYLSRNGTIFFVASSLADIPSLEKHMKKENYEFSVDRKKHISFEDIIIYKAKIKKAGTKPANKK